MHFFGGIWEAPVDEKLDALGPMAHTGGRPWIGGHLHDSTKDQVTEVFNIPGG